MYQTTFMDYLPLWAVFVGTTCLIAVAAEIGILLGRRRLSQQPDLRAPNLGSLVAATLGLLAFILAFTFSAGTNRLDAKRSLVLEEANSIGTAWLRTDLLPEPQQDEIRRLLADYVNYLLVVQDSHEEAGVFSTSQEFAEQAMSQIVEARGLHDRLWQEAMMASRQVPEPATLLFVQSLNDVIDVLQKRVTTSFQQRMPPIFWLVLYCLATLAIGLAGYDTGVSGADRSLASWAVAVAFATVMFLVVALDRPQSSSIRHLPLIDLKADIEAALRR